MLFRSQIGYTPAPDIIHEAAGHAPIIADPVYANYLREFGRIGSKAFSSPYDMKVYEAIRHLSILKADPNTDPAEISQAEGKLAELGKKNGEPSELALIRNLHWWSVEYGLIGEIENPKIYGAGLLSSIAESYYCLQPEVKKLPYSIDAIHCNFDITEPQPQLFVTPDFNTLTSVLHEFAGQMALMKGGVEGVQKAIRSEAVATVEYSSGLQISGVFTNVIQEKGEPAYIQVTGPASLNYRGVEISGQGKEYHSHGFGSPVGNILQMMDHKVGQLARQ